MRSVIWSSAMLDLKEVTFDECDRLFSEVEQDLSTQRIYAAMNRLFKIHTLLSVDLERGEIFWRGQKCPSAKGFDSVSRLNYPPPELTRVGRLNDLGQPLLYCATNPVTVFNELRARDGEFIHLIALKHFPEVTIRMAKIGDAYELFRAGNTRLISGGAATHLLGMMRRQSGDPRFMPNLYIDAFLSSVLAERDADKKDYLQTRAIATEALRKRPEIDGLFYPTVREPTGTNAAFKPLVRNKLQIVASAVFEIQRRRRLGFYEYAIVRDAAGIDAPDTVRWANFVRLGRIRFFGMTEDEAKQDELLHESSGLPFSYERD